MIAIVGTGVAGITAAEALRDLGFRGEVRLFSAEPDAPFDRPTLSKAFLLDHEASEPPALYAPARLAELELSLELGTEVVAIDCSRRVLETAAGEAVEYEQLLLATGAEPRRLELPGSELTGIHYLRDIADARALRAALHPGGTVAIVGGGVIGLEVAASAIELGAAVTVIEGGPHVMGRIVPEALARRVEDLHRTRGVEFRLATMPVAFEGSGGAVGAVALADGSRVAADIVVVGIGAVPRTALAAAAGLAVDDGILVDDRFASSDEDVFAAGDVARVFHSARGEHLRIEQWGPAQEQGRKVAAGMLGLGAPYRDVPWMWSDQHDLHLQAAGFGFGAVDDVVLRGDPDERGGFACLGSSEGRLVAAAGVSVGTSVARTVRAAKRLIEAGTPVDPEQLADPGTELRRLART